MPTVEELGQRVKSKYSGAYDSLSDAEVGRRVKLKYPGAYDDFVDAPVDAPAATNDEPGPIKKFLSATAGSFAAGIGGVIEGLGGALTAGDQMAGAQTGGGVMQLLSSVATGGASAPSGIGPKVSAVGAYLSKQPKWLEDAAQKPDRWTDPAFLSSLAFSGVGSTAASFLPGGVAASATGKAAAVARLIPVGKLRAAAQVAAGTGVGAFFESLTDAGSAYNEAIEKHGASPETAADVFKATLKNETPVTALLSAPEHMLPGGKGKLAKALWGVYNAASEGIEEVAQGAAQRHAMNQVLGTSTPLLQGAPEEFVGGILGGAGVSGARLAANRLGAGSVTQQPMASAEDAPAEDTPGPVPPMAPVESPAQQKLANINELKAKARQTLQDRVEQFAATAEGPVRVSDVTQALEIGNRDAVRALTALTKEGKLRTDTGGGWVSMAPALPTAPAAPAAVEQPAPQLPAMEAQVPATEPQPLAVEPQPAAEPTAPAGLPLSGKVRPQSAPSLDRQTKQNQKRLPKPEPQPQPAPQEQPQQGQAPAAEDFARLPVEEQKRRLAEAGFATEAPAPKEAPPKEKFEAPARAKKVGAYVDFLKKNEFTPDMVDQISDRQWQAVAQAAGQQPPSANTIAAIKAKMREQPATEPAAAPKPTPVPKAEEKAAATEAVAAGWVGNIPTNDIAVDPVRFQFKRNTGGKAGVGDEFKEVRRWDPEKAGIVAVWHDPANGRTYVVNGHHRVEMANRLGVDKLTVRYLRADNAAEARLKGAMINIAEGRGDSIDAAKVFREDGMTEKELADQGISLKGKVASEGLALSKLHPMIFSDVLSGELPAARAAVIGAALTSHEDQKAIYDLVRKAESRGKRLTNDQVAELIRQQKGTPQHVERQETLFGEEVFSRSLVLEKAEVSDYVRKQLAGERKLFATVGQQRAAEKLGQAGNVIDASRNQEIADEANQGLAIYDKLSLSAGEISDALNAAAEQIANGENSEKAKQQAYSRIRGNLVEQIDALTGKKAARGRSVRGTQGLGEEGSRETGSGEPNREVNPKRGEQTSIPIEEQPDYRAAVQRDQLTAGFAAPLTPQEKAAKLTPAPPPQTDMFAEEQPADQGDLFGSRDSSVYLGSGLGALQAWFDKRPNWTLQINPRAWLKGALKDGVVRDVIDSFRPLGSVLSEAGGGAGGDIMIRIRRANDNGEVLAGRRLVQLVDARLDKLTDQEAQNLMDALEGREEPMNDRVRAAYRVAQNLHVEIGGEAMDLGMEMRDEDGSKKPVEIGASAFPHIVRPVDALKSGPVRRDVLRNLVHIGAAENAEQATAMLDGYIATMQSGKREKAKVDAILKHFVNEGIAANEDQAWHILQKHRRDSMNPKRYAPLEYAQPVVPFWDPDPRRVLPQHVVGASMRTAHVAELGQENEVVTKGLRRIEEAGGNAAEAKKQVDRILNHIDQAETREMRISRLLRAVQGFKLGLAAVNNATQGTLNTMLEADLGAVAVGFKSMFTTAGRRFAIESGATIDPVLHESVKELAGSSRALDRYLRATGFNATERANRVFAANAGAAYAQKLAKRGDKRSREVLAELGLDAEEVIARENLTPEEVLLAAKKFSDITQFRARPEDLPAFAAHPMGRVFFQFKSFAYAQTRFVTRNTVGEIQRGNYGRALRSLLVLGMAFPLAGELVRELRALLSGRERKDLEGIPRLLDSMAAVGTLGMFYDMVEAGDQGRFLEFLTGPTFSEVAKLGKNLFDGDKDAEEKLVRMWKDHVAPRLGPLRRIGQAIEE